MTPMAKIPDFHYSDNAVLVQVTANSVAVAHHDCHNGKLLELAVAVRDLK